MKRLDRSLRSQILHLLCEGNSIRATGRITGASKTTVTKLLVDAGQAAAWYQDRVFRSLECQRVQIDEIWGFVGAKQKNVPKEKKGEAGDIWVWVATDADTKLVPQWRVGPRDLKSCAWFIAGLAERVEGHFQLTSDAFHIYGGAVEGFLGKRVDYAQVIKVFGTDSGNQGRYSPPTCIGCRTKKVIGNPDEKHISTSYAERNNLNIRMHQRRMTRLTNAFSKKVENHAHAMALHFLYYNFVRVHQTLKMTPAMAAGVTRRLWEMGDVVDMLEAWEAAVVRQSLGIK
ncbi:MAG: IS1 family transposase [Methyloceanibacter sp.]|uniref:IS1 family transposase n=1 Tax=Methyloceanibacter sp. TaxID=1965321 RepID=UPI003D6CF752